MLAYRRIYRKLASIWLGSTDKTTRNTGGLVTVSTVRRLVELMPVAVYVCDRSGIIQSYNNRAVELWGREPQWRKRWSDLQPERSNSDSLHLHKQFWRRDGRPVMLAPTFVAGRGTPGTVWTGSIPRTRRLACQRWN